jgi:hypothetical protein
MARRKRALSVRSCPSAGCDGSYSGGLSTSIASYYHHQHRHSASEHPSWTSRQLSTSALFHGSLSRA